MSDTRLNILSFIQDSIDSKGYAPTVREIGRGCGVGSPSVIQHHLNVLEKQGYIRRDPQVFRSIQLVKQDGKDDFKVPVLGTIAASEPFPVPNSNVSSDISEETVRLPWGINGDSKDLYALRVKGTSMVDALVDDGDIVVMQAQEIAADGDMVVVWLRDKQEVTLKRFFRESDKIRLQPVNQLIAPIYVDPEDVMVQGKVITVIRQIY